MSEDEAVADRLQPKIDDLETTLSALESDLDIENANLDFARSDLKAILLTAREMLQELSEGSAEPFMETDAERALRFHVVEADDLTATGVYFWDGSVALKHHIGETQASAPWTVHEGDEGLEDVLAALPDAESAELVWIDEPPL